MFKRFMLCVVITISVGTCKASSESSSEFFSMVNSDMVDSVKDLLVQDKNMRQNNRERRHRAIREIDLPTDLLKYKILPYDGNSEPRLIDMKNEDEKTVVESTLLPLVLAPDQLAKRRRVISILKKFARDPEYK